MDALYNTKFSILRKRTWKHGRVRISSLVKKRYLMIKQTHYYIK